VTAWDRKPQSPWPRPSRNPSSAAAVPGASWIVGNHGVGRGDAEEANSPAGVRRAHRQHPCVICVSFVIASFRSKPARQPRSDARTMTDRVWMERRDGAGYDFGGGRTEDPRAAMSPTAGADVSAVLRIGEHRCEIVVADSRKSCHDVSFLIYCPVQWSDLTAPK